MALGKTYAEKGDVKCLVLYEILSFRQTFWSCTANNQSQGEIFEVLNYSLLTFLDNVTWFSEHYCIINITALSLVLLSFVSNH